MGQGSIMENTPHLMRKCLFLLTYFNPQFKKDNNSTSQEVWFIERGPQSMKCPFLVRYDMVRMVCFCMTNELWCTQQIKSALSWQIAKKSPWWWVSTLHLCTESHLSNIPFSFLSIYSITGRQHVFILFSWSFRPFWGLTVHLIAYILYFYVVSFPTEKPRIN